jgi:cathepsin L
MFDLSVHQTAMCAPNPSKKICNLFGNDAACTIPSSGSPVATIDGYVTLPFNNYTALMNAIATVGPIAVSVDASAWSPYESGIFDNCNQDQPDIDHAVVLVGYGEESNGSKYWIIRNSWSPTWGEKGYIRIARTDNEETRCGMDTTPQDGTACEGETQAVKVCGTCGVLFDSAYPLKPSLVKK